MAEISQGKEVQSLRIGGESQAMEELIMKRRKIVIAKGLFSFASS